MTSINLDETYHRFRIGAGEIWSEGQYGPKALLASPRIWAEQTARRHRAKLDLIGQHLEERNRAFG
jgi:hypothetical protein